MSGHVPETPREGASVGGSLPDSSRPAVDKRLSKVEAYVATYGMMLRPLDSSSSSSSSPLLSSSSSPPAAPIPELRPITLLPTPPPARASVLHAVAGNRPGPQSSADLLALNRPSRLHAAAAGAGNANANKPLQPNSFHRPFRSPSSTSAQMVPPPPPPPNTSQGNKSSSKVEASGAPVLTPSEMAAVLRDDLEEWEKPRSQQHQKVPKEKGDMILRVPDPRQSSEARAVRFNK